MLFEFPIISPLGPPWPSVFWKIFLDVGFDFSASKDPVYPFLVLYSCISVCFSLVAFTLDFTTRVRNYKAMMGSDEGTRTVSRPSLQPMVRRCCHWTGSWDPSWTPKRTEKIIVGITWLDFPMSNLG